MKQKLTCLLRNPQTFVTALLLLVATASLHAQNGPPPGFDPAQMRQQMLERLREQLEVKDDAEWQLVSERVQKVMDARRSFGGPGGLGGFRFMGPGGPPPGSPDQPRPDAASGPGGQGGSSQFRPPSNPELDALQKALEAKAPTAEVKAKLTDLRAARQKQEAELANAQEQLKQILSVRQEAVAVMFGLLK
jgi:hypothetical protein